MADRRMFSKRIVESARFLKMPASSQNLYFHLGLNADDDGIVEAYPIMNLIKAHEDDLRVLFSKGFIRILNEDLVAYMVDWRENNYIRADRKKDSIYKDLLLQMEPEADLLEMKPRSDAGKKSGPSTDNQRTAQCSVGKGSIGKVSIGKCSTQQEQLQKVIYQLDHETLMENEYHELIAKYSIQTVEEVIRRILSKPYHGCLNVKTISSWCEEHRKEKNDTQTHTSKHSSRLMELAQERN